MNLEEPLSFKSPENSFSSDIYHELFNAFVRRHQLASNELTEKQLAEAIRQAMPDFTRYVMPLGQMVVYLPGQDANRWKNKCDKAESTVEALTAGLKQIQERICNTPDQSPALMKVGMAVGALLAGIEK
jgi:hypothetical protein